MKSPARAGLFILRPPHSLDYDSSADRNDFMPFVVTENCIKCKYTDCVEVCPVDCFHEGPNFLVINPDECIDCGVCIPECPVDAIVDDVNVDVDVVFWTDLNGRLSKKWPVI